MFRLSCDPIDHTFELKAMSNEQAGALLSFEGRVRNHNEGLGVSSLEYQVYEELALKEGQKIVSEARAKFNIIDVLCIHRYGHLSIGDIAIFIAVNSAHRDDSYKASRYIIDEVKTRLPIWKKEHYTAKEPTWVFCKDHSHHVHFQDSDYYEKQALVVNQKQLSKSRILVVGVGGLGTALLTSLVSAGVGIVDIVDFDKINISNIHRQPLFTPNLVGEKKVTIAKAKLVQLNPFITINAHDTYVDVDNVFSLIDKVDLVVDCTDNMKTKFLIHDACRIQQKNLISASIFKFEAKIRTFVAGTQFGCMRCGLDSEPLDSQIGNCNDFGVLGAAVSTVANMQALETIKFLQESQNNTVEKTLLLSLDKLEQMKISNTVEADCSYCSGNFKIESRSHLETSIENFDTHKNVLIDIRDFSDEHIYKAADKYCYKNKNTIFYCERGHRSLDLVTALRDKGYLNFLSLRGGASSLL